MRTRLGKLAAPAMAITIAAVAAGCDTRLTIGEGNSQARGVSAGGWIVGSYQQADPPRSQAFVVSPDGSVRHVGLAPGACGGRTTLTAVNDGGTAVGEHFVNNCSGGFMTPVRWTATGGVERLSGVIAGSANDINDAGQITGLGLITGPQPVVWEPDGTLRELSPVTGNAFVQPVAINDHGDVLGSAPEGPYLWPAATGVPVPLSTGGLVGEFVATDLNDRGDVVGQLSAEGRRSAVVWPAGGDPVVLEGGIGDTHATAVDAGGGIVGWITVDAEGRRRAAYWGPGGRPVQVLADLGGTTAEAHDIADDGTIVGQVYLDAGRTEAARWDRPAPAT